MTHWSTLARTVEEWNTDNKNWRQTQIQFNIKIQYKSTIIKQQQNSLHSKGITAVQDRPGKRNKNQIYRKRRQFSEGTAPF